MLERIFYASYACLTLFNCIGHLLIKVPQCNLGNYSIRQFNKSCFPINKGTFLIRWLIKGSFLYYVEEWMKLHYISQLSIIIAFLAKLWSVLSISLRLGSCYVQIKTKLFSWLNGVSDLKWSVLRPGLYIFLNYRGY